MLGRKYSPSFQTTAHTLCFTLGLLALNPDQQEIMYQSVKKVLSDGRMPVSAEFQRLVKIPLMEILFFCSGV